MWESLETIGKEARKAAFHKKMALKRALEENLRRMQAGQPLKPFAVISTAEAMEAQNRAQRLIAQAQRQAEIQRQVAAWQKQWEEERRKHVALQQALTAPVVTQPGPAGTVRVR